MCRTLHSRREGRSTPSSVSSVEVTLSFYPIHADVRHIDAVSSHSCRYSWEVVVCEGCGDVTHLGWKFTKNGLSGAASNIDYFYVRSYVTSYVRARTSVSVSLCARARARARACNPSKHTRVLTLSSLLTIFAAMTMLLLSLSSSAFLPNGSPARVICVPGFDRGLQ